MVRKRCSPTRAVRHSSYECSIAPRRRHVDGLCGRPIGRRKKTSTADGSLLFRQSVLKFPRLQQQDQEADLQPRADAALRSGQGKGCESNRHCQRLCGRCNPNRRDSKRECSRPKPAALKVRCRRDKDIPCQKLDLRCRSGLSIRLLDCTGIRGFRTSDD